ncbi:uncharacterized protein KY384_004538 [Bacidia gigantensis]|uniref:uncharacterized protein n=1 Tax=Bacidia gigantensis TaxID=2732470 RepID=UPI001D051D46|nr:uncharacterized protein KY384_004538 [Bacidia gigantensis]KAG8531180.1 hypothetical protein KY384_004538 [Bacidia gigantensis]
MTRREHTHSSSVNDRASTAGGSYRSTGSRSQAPSNGQSSHTQGRHELHSHTADSSSGIDSHRHHRQQSSAGSFDSQSPSELAEQHYSEQGARPAARIQFPPRFHWLIKGILRKRPDLDWMMENVWKNANEETFERAEQSLRDGPGDDACDIFGDYGRGDKVDPGAPHTHPSEWPSEFLRDCFDPEGRDHQGAGTSERGSGHRDGGRGDSHRSSESRRETHHHGTSASSSHGGSSYGGNRNDNDDRYEDQY